MDGEEDKPLVLSLSSAVIFTCVLTISLAIWNYFRWKKQGGMAKILFTIYILAMILMLGIIYSLVSYNNWARYEMITQKLIIYIRVLFGNAYLVSMVENESLI